MDVETMAEMESRNKAKRDGRTDLRQGYLFVAIGILLVGSPVFSVISVMLGSSPLSPNEDASNESVWYKSMYRYWTENGRYWRILTFLPAALVICICHWVSLRIYLRR